MRNLSSRLGGFAWLAILVIATLSCRAQAPGARLVDWFSVDGGGGRSEGTRFAITGTIGQVDAGELLRGGRYCVAGGFWGYFAVDTPGAPPLEIEVLGPSLIRVTWAPDASTWVLQSSPDLEPDSWSNTSSGGTHPVELTVAARLVFFRLSRP